MSSATVDQQARILTYLGVLPFLLAVLICISQYVQLPEVLGGNMAYASYKAKAIAHSYAVVIISFLAGTQWGISLGSVIDRRLYLISNILALIAWFSLFLFATVQALAVMVVAFIMALLTDQRAFKHGMLPSWYWHLRIKITAWVIISLALVMWLS